MTDLARLHPADVQAIAAAVTANITALLVDLGDPPAPAFELVTVAQLAELTAGMSVRPGLRLVAVNGERCSTPVSERRPLA